MIRFQTLHPGSQVLQKPKLLITGASGMLGQALCPMASKDWMVCGVYHRHVVGSSDVQVVRADLTDLEQVRGLLATVQPKAVIHAAAVSQPADCEQNPMLSQALNVQLSILIAQWCADRQIPLVFTSTDLVFDGRNAPYNENHPVSPLCVYSRHKAKAEQAVLEGYPEALVCRLPLMFGPAARPNANFTLQIIRAMQDGRSISLFTDEYRTPVDTPSAAAGILTLLGKARGVLHLGGRSRLSRYDMGLMIAEQLGADPEIIKPVTIASMDLRVARSPDCSLDSQRAYRLGYAPTAFATALAQVVAKARQPTAR
jgi:dTDP-4-dehydrorhamnose reductase